MKLPLLGGWREDPLWSYVHPWLVEHEHVADISATNTGSSIVTDTGTRYEPLRRIGARTGVLGPMCTTGEARRWWQEAGCDRVDLRVHGALGYFRATRGGTP